LLGFVLIAALWLGYIFVTKQMEPEKKPAKAVRQVEAEKKKDVPSKPVKDLKVKLDPVQAGEEKVVTAGTRIYDVTFTTKGAAIKNLFYKEKKINLTINTSSLPDPQKKAVPDAITPLDFAIHFNEAEFLKGSDLGNVNWILSVESPGKYRFSTKLTINGIPVQIEKTYVLSEKDYFIKLEYKIRNLGKDSLTFKDEGIIFSPGTILGPELDFTNVYNKITSIYSSGGSYQQSEKGGFFSKGGDAKKESGKIDWVGLMSRYALVIMLPEGFSGTEMIHDNRENSLNRTGIIIKTPALKAGETITKSFKAYLGEKDKTKLLGVDKSLGDASDVSKWIEPIRWFVLWTLLGINKVVNNIGWALVIFSLLTKIVFMPLTIKSNQSMKRMQQLTPKLNELKAKYKDKPDIMQKEMMSLYKEHKVNPLGGCFPLLLQMPFFFALYSALINSIDLWHAPFIFWIKDLSMPDTVMNIPLFGTIYNLNILPLLMTATTFLQQKLSSVDTGSQQQKMMLYTMPLIFIFIFWNMPSGLVLYWTLQNVFQILHQLIINKRSEVKEAQ